MEPDDLLKPATRLELQGLQLTVDTRMSGFENLLSRMTENLERVTENQQAVIKIAADQTIISHRLGALEKSVERSETELDTLRNQTAKNTIYISTALAILLVALEIGMKFFGS